MRELALVVAALLSLGSVVAILVGARMCRQKTDPRCCDTGCCSRD